MGGFETPESSMASGSQVDMDYIGSPNLGPTLGSDPESLETAWCAFQSGGAGQKLRCSFQGRPQGMLLGSAHCHAE